MTLRELIKELRAIGKVHPDALDHQVRVISNLNEPYPLLRSVGYNKKRKAILLEDE